MNTEEVFNNFYPQLVKTLPMKDSCFIAELRKCEFFPGDLQDKVKEQDTKANMATVFLDEAIKPYLNFKKEISPFWKLLLVMDEYGTDLKQVAAQIKEQLNTVTLTNEIRGRPTS